MQFSDMEEGIRLSDSIAIFLFCLSKKLNKFTKYNMENDIP